MKDNNDYLKGVLFALLNSFSLGTVGLIDKIGSSKLNNPFIFSSQSVFFGLVFTFIFTLIYFNNSFRKTLKNISFYSWKLIILVGVFASGLFILFRFLGLTQSTGTFATLSQVVTTSITAILASFFLKEKLKKSFWVLFIIILFAMYLVSIGKFDFVTMKMGDILILIGALFLASANIFSKIAVKKTSPIVLSLGRFFFGFIFLMLVSVLLFNQGNSLFNISFWSIISGLLWATSVLAFNLGVKRIGVILLTSILMTAPVYTMVLEFLFLHRNFNTIQIVAALVAVVCGILIITPRSKLRTSTPRVES